MKCVHIRTTNNRFWKLKINMKKRSVVLVRFQEPISSSWAFIYTFVMLIQKNRLSHPGFDTYSSICLRPGVPPFSHAKSLLPGLCPVLRSRFHNRESDCTEVTLNVRNELQPPGSLRGTLYHDLQLRGILSYAPCVLMNSVVLEANQHWIR